MSKQIGILLINLGTPEGELVGGPSVAQVREYLAEFLMDPYVIDMAFPLRWLLVHGIILPKRPAKSAEAYRKIWTENGSPLKFYHHQLAEKMSARLGDRFVVAPAMRYGTPSIPKALAQLIQVGIQELFILPLYPQYSLAATESSLEVCRQWIAKNAPDLQTRVCPPFFKESGFIRAFTDVASASLRGFEYDHLLFSFHGLPERHIRKIDHTHSQCLSTPNCCEKRGESRTGEGDCYRAQCFTTAREMARAMGLAKDRFTVCFQSRLNSRWIRPYTDVVYKELARQGVKRVAVLCPAFVADCLETLEEIGIRAREEFLAEGGVDLKLVPSLNANPSWISELSGLIEETYP